MKLSEYILLPRTQRIEHIDLTTECVTGKKWRKSTFLDYLNIEDDIPNWKESKIERCHLCECNSRNGHCVNPLHVYIGTPKENAADRPQEYLIEAGKRLGSAPVSDESRRKMSESARARTDDREIPASKVRIPISLQNKVTGEVHHFKSQKEAAEVLKINMGNLSGVARGFRKSVNGFTLYVNE